MLELTDGSPSGRMIGVLAAVLSMAFAVPALAQASGGSSPAAQSSAQAMEAMTQQMMQRMQQCMDQLVPMNSTDPKAMRRQMMRHLHGRHEACRRGTRLQRNEGRARTGSESGAKADLA